MYEIKFIISYVLLISLLCVSTTVSAHSNSLDIVYDDCGDVLVENGAIINDEMWYSLISHNVVQERHIFETTTVIKYYFMEESVLDNNERYTWTTDVSEDVANEIKQSYVDSMKKWNNVYYYTYDENNNRIVNKIITVVEGTEEDHNLKIYPLKTGGLNNKYAETGLSQYPDDISSPEYMISVEDSNSSIAHNH